jgi:hypothetical protein
MLVTRINSGFHKLVDSQTSTKHTVVAPISIPTEACTMTNLINLIIIAIITMLCACSKTQDKVTKDLQPETQNKTDVSLKVNQENKNNSSTTNKYSNENERIKKEIEQTVLSYTKEKISNASEIKVNRIEKANPSKSFMDKNNPKSVYCIECEYNRKHKQHSSRYIVLLMQSGEHGLICMSSITDENYNKLPKSLRDKEEWVDKTIRSSFETMNRYWDSMCPFQSTER